MPPASKPAKKKPRPAARPKAKADPFDVLLDELLAAAEGGLVRDWLEKLRAARRAGRRSDSRVRADPRKPR